MNKHTIDIVDRKKAKKAGYLKHRNKDHSC